jgi:hypothetical protein
MTGRRPGKRARPEPVPDLGEVAAVARRLLDTVDRGDLAVEAEDPISALVVEPDECDGPV